MKWFEDKLGLFTFLGILASILLALFVDRGQRRLQHETETQTIIHDQYELCRALDVERVEHPEISHMLALPPDPTGPSAPGAKRDPWANYHLFRENVRSIATPKDPAALDQSKKELYLKEHAVALHVFDIYEQTRLQRDAAAKAEDDARTQILNMLVDYYETQLLRNPRLRYHWLHGGSDLLTQESVAAYNKALQPFHDCDFVDEGTPLDPETPPPCR